MTRKARQRISYVLPLENAPGGHRLGVNGLAVDTEQSILYSGGRDGLICAWDLRHGPRNDEEALRSRDPAKDKTSRGSSLTSVFKNQIQAHTHWINDIVLAQSNAILVTASSDTTVKVWRPHSEESRLPRTIGHHNDYVKCLASPSAHCDWVASGGLDHKIRVWDLTGAGERLQINVGEDDNNAKGSVYALSVQGAIMASGGPESIVRLWDSNSGKRITKFVGHTDNVRSILISQDGDMVMTASSDQTVKVWSMTAGRCMYTLTMHNASVWSLYSDHPRLSVFYSGDRSGLIAKTDVRGCDEMDRGISLAIAQEQEGVNKLVATQDFFWTATSSSSINRWRDVNTQGEIQPPESNQPHRHSITTFRSKRPSPPPQSPTIGGDGRTKILLSSLLRISNNVVYSAQRSEDTDAATIYSIASTRKMSEAIFDHDHEVVTPVHNLPQETIEGQNGLIKHVMLNDRKRVLTLDTAGEVLMWDLLKCIPVQSFGKRHLEDVAPEVNTTESVANWCGVDTRTGRLACVLEENYCFDAEIYADELDLTNSFEFREDQRINLGKWVLRYLFDELIKEEIKRDESYKRELSAVQRPHRMHRTNKPSGLQLPTYSPTPANETAEDDFSITPRDINGNALAVATPGLSIAVATPYPGNNSQGSTIPKLAATTGEENLAPEKQISALGKLGDYFSSTPNEQNASEEDFKGATTPGETSSEATTQSPVDADNQEKSKETTSLFGKKFRMNFPKKLGRTSTEVKTAVIDEKSEGSEKSEEKEDKLVQDSFLGSVQKIRYDYEEQLQMIQSQSPPVGITPSLPNETPELRLPPSTTIIIQEDRPDSGGIVDLYSGTIESAGRDADLIEQTGPMWLGDLLLRNQIPFKEVSKVSFVLLPYQDLLPNIASPDGNSRLNANRMLRAKKILAYVAERIEPQAEQADPEALKPEEYLELYCQNQLVGHNTTLATLRAHIWKIGGDVVLHYKSTGRKPDLERIAAAFCGQARPETASSQ